MPKITVAEGASNIDAPAAATRTFAHDVASVDALAERAYCAYAAARDWKSYNGDDLPDWGDQDEGIAEGWRAVARELRGVILEPGGARAIATRPERVESGSETGDDSPAPYDETYPSGGTATEVEAWVDGDPDRAAYALDREHGRIGGPRAGLSASLGKLIPADTD